MAALTPKIVCYMGFEEGLVREAYRDTKMVWTWAMGVAETGGFNVKQYKDNPQSLDAALRASISLINSHYLPPVLKAFGKYVPAENELAAALSFHWNTGAIGSTNWVALVRSGDRTGAQSFLRTHYLNNGTLTDRRAREADLFFKGKWPNPMLTNVQSVSKPSYKPFGSHPTDITAAVQAIMGGSQEKTDG